MHNMSLMNTISSMEYYNTVILVNGTGTAGLPFKFFISVPPGTGTDPAR